MGKREHYEGGRMASKKNNKNSNGTDNGTLIQDTPPTPSPWDNGSGNRKRFQKFFQDFKTGIAVGIVLGIGGTILTAYFTNLRGGGGLHFLGGLHKTDIFKITIASPILDRDCIDRGQFVRGIGDKEDINTETIIKEIEIKEESLIEITGNSHGEFNPGKNGKNTGRIVCKIMINHLDCALDSESICTCKCDPWKFPIPMGTSVQYSKVVSPGTYTVTVEATFYGCIENPRTSMQYVVLRLGPATIAQMNGMNLDEKKQ